MATTKEAEAAASPTQRKTWVSSEKRQRSAMLGLRLLPEERRLLDEEARGADCAAANSAAHHTIRPNHDDALGGCRIPPVYH